MSAHVDLKHWAPRLAVFRFYVPSRGNADSHPVRLRALFHLPTEALKRELLGTLGLASWREGAWNASHVAGGVLRSLPRGSSVTLATSGADPVTEADCEHAARVEPLLAHYRRYVIDPPEESRDCLSPKHHPELFVPPARVVSSSAQVPYTPADAQEELRVSEFIKEVRSTGTVSRDMLQQLEATHQEGSPEARERVERMMLAIQETVHEGHLVTVSGTRVEILREPREFSIWAAECFTSPRVPEAASTGSGTVTLDVSGTWEDPVWLAGRTRKRVVLKQVGAALRGDCWDFTTAGHGASLEWSGAVTGTLHEDGSADWVMPQYGSYGTDVVRGRFSGSTFEGSYVDVEEPQYGGAGEFVLVRVSG
ncbi:hypothetical protein [Pyxidicoccus xibeiensis]|uniref:hypothetical protein n=1 Tax=Pyxidicoccus xibeiensis TaxID=2906759 RepID=UPI0020A74CED|nr:hypothetical protein [Pyxidicoccus xibeiensis]MCP3139378.1 hypothetical protein [Pyxidicoccus xibeiensis]